MENRLVSALIALYISIFLYTEASFVKTLTVLKGSDQLFYNHITILIIFFIPIFFVINKYISSYSDKGLRGYLKLFLLVVSILGLIGCIIYHIIPIAPIYHLPAYLNPVFATDQIYTIWLIAPIVVLFF
jgi:hypothetical protein